MSHVVRLAFLTLLAFAAMSAYFLMPPHAEYWERAAATESAAHNGMHVVSIFIGQPRPEPEASSMGGGGAMEFLRYEEPVRGSRGEGLGAGDPVGSSSSARDGGASEDAEPDPDGDAPRDSEREGGGAATRAAPRTRPYTIAKGDTISTIAARELGSTRYVKAIEALNPRVVATRLIPGQVLLLPEAEDADTDGTPVARDVKIQVVDLKKGETLVSLAQKHLGDGNRWREILKLNENHISSTNLSSLPVGMRVRVPAGR